MSQITETDVSEKLQAAAMPWNEAFFLEMATSYEDFVISVIGDACLDTARLFHSQLIDDNLNVHDNACGTGLMSKALIENLEPHQHMRIYCTDVSPGMIDAVRARCRTNPTWTQNVAEAKTMNGMDLEYADMTFAASFTMFAIFLFPDPAKGVREIFRTLVPGGLAVVSGWQVSLPKDDRGSNG